MQVHSPHSNSSPESHLLDAHHIAIVPEAKKSDGKLKIDGELVVL